MSGKLTLDTEAGGSVTITVDDTETGDIEYPLDSAGIESGESGFKGYVKFPDGTMICYERGFTLSYLEQSTNVFGSTSGTILHARGTPVFLEPFLSIPTVVVSVKKSGMKGATAQLVTETGFTCDSYYDGSEKDIAYIAIGRWK